jgi:hypothetical protein
MPNASSAPVVPTASPEPDLVAEAQRLLAAAHESDVPVRLIGGLAVRLHVADLPAALTREYKDIDLVTVQHGEQAASRLMEASGYVPNPEFNALNGHRRLMFADPATQRQVDVFVGQFVMCHEIPITERLHLDPISIPLAELLLTKLQVVELNERDNQDTLAIVLAHEVASDDADAINADRVAELCAADWGLWRTCTENLERASTAAPA